MQQSNETLTPSYFSILTADIRYNKKLSANEKILYSEITALTNNKGYCSANNLYFSKLYNVDTRTIQRWISNLNKHGFIEIQTIANKRLIYITIITKTKKQQKKVKQKQEPTWLQDYINNFESNVENL